MYQHQLDATDPTIWIVNPRRQWQCVRCGAAAAAIDAQCYCPDADVYPVERLAARAPHESEGAEARSTAETEIPDRS